VQEPRTSYRAKRGTSVVNASTAEKKRKSSATTPRARK
jgi:hypothetical protein